MVGFGERCSIRSAIAKNPPSAKNSVMLIR
jgi:hypothetical protein